MTKGLLMTALITGSVVWGGTSVFAEELQEYTLDQMVVTAQRTETRDLDTPASVTVINEKKIQNAGYKNVFDAIENQVGLVSTGYGDAGQDFGFSSGRTTIRGYDRGTLVMVDGIPMNMKTYNSLSGIPLDMVEKIEIVKGAAGTLYGSEAMGGVVNIITKRPQGKEQIKVKGTVGNYYKDYGVTYSSDKLILSVGKEYSNDIQHSNAYPTFSKYDWWVGKGQTQKAAIAANLTDEIALNFMYQDGNITRGNHNKKAANYDYRFDDTRMTTGLSYTGKDNGVKANLGYTYRKIDGFDFAANEVLESSATMSNYIADVQKKWEFGKNTLIAGVSNKRENYKNATYGNANFHRINNALYLSYNNVFSDKFSATLGLRAEKINDPVEDQNVFNPQIQTLYKFDDDTSWFINVGRAFQMPSVDSHYNHTAHTKYNVSSVKPEKGWTYETGVKKFFGDQSVKFSVYHMDFTDKLGWSTKDPLTGEQHPINVGDFRNTGVEVEFNHQLNDNWSYGVGLGLSNPEVKSYNTSKKVWNDWAQDSARIDGSANITYSKDKLASTLSFKYLGDREDYSTYGQVPSKIRLTWNTSYDLTPSDNITLTLNNLLGRENYANKYGNLELPYNWRLMYTHTF